MELLKAINLIAVFQIIVFIVILARRKELKRESKIFLILFLLAILYCLMDRTQYFYREFINKKDFPHFYNSGEPFWYLHLPLLYMYIKSVTTSDFRFKWIQLIHAIPFVITLIYVLVNFSLLPTDVKNLMLRDESVMYRAPHYVRFFVDMLFIQNLYILASYYLIFRYQKQMRSYVSSIRWYNVAPLYIVVSMFTLMFIIRTVIPLLFKTKYNVPIDIDLTVYAITILFIGFKQSRFILNPPTFLKESSNEKFDTQFKNSILQFMVEEKPHLNPDLTLELLAEHLHCSPRKLSQVLNCELDSNFFSFINKYRVEEAKKCLADSAQKQKTVLEILYEVGFNNKSAFNRVFKEFTQLTPTQYRNMELSSGKP